MITKLTHQKVGQIEVGGHNTIENDLNSQPSFIWQENKKEAVSLQGLHGVPVKIQQDIRQVGQ